MVDRGMVRRAPVCMVGGTVRRADSSDLPEDQGRGLDTYALVRSHFQRVLMPGFVFPEELLGLLDRDTATIVET